MIFAVFFLPLLTRHSGPGTFMRQLLAVPGFLPEATCAIPEIVCSLLAEFQKASEAFWTITRRMCAIWRTSCTVLEKDPAQLASALHRARPSVWGTRRWQKVSWVWQGWQNIGNWDFMLGHWNGWLQCGVWDSGVLAVSGPSGAGPEIEILWQLAETPEGPLSNTTRQGNQKSRDVGR